MKTIQPGRTLTELLQEFGLGDQDWDYVLIGDGSGFARNKESAYATFLIERETGRVEPCYGAFSHASINAAELLAYLVPLSWLNGYYRERKQAQGSLWRVHIFTDSEFTANVGNDRISSGPLAEYWAMVNIIRRRGLTLHWHWIPRDTYAWSQMADFLAGQVRKRNLKQDILPLLAPYRPQISDPANRLARHGPAKRQAGQRRPLRPQGEADPAG